MLAAAAGYWYWTTTPLYALQEAMMAAQNHDALGFERRVMTTELVDNLLDDLLVYPALTTPKLSAFQLQVASGALAMAKAKLSTQMLEAISKALNAPVTYGDSHYDQSTSRLPLIRRLRVNFWETPAYAASESGDFLRTVGKELGGEVGKLKNTAFERMQNYMHNHPATIPGRLANCHPNDRGATLRRILADHGLSQNNFKGMTAVTIGELDEPPPATPAVESALPMDAGPDLNVSKSPYSPDQFAHVGLRFYSPIISDEVILKIEFFKAKENSTGDEPYADTWRVKRISNLRQILGIVGQDYLNEVHELIAYSLHGMNNENMARDMKGITDRIKSHPSAQKILNKIGF